MDTCGEAEERLDAYWRDCPARMVLDIVANKWTMLAVSALSDGPRRHGDLRRRLEGISPKMLSQTLRLLERHGIVTRTQFPTVPPRVEYELTELGHGLRTSVAAVKQWAEANARQMVAAQHDFDRRPALQPWYA